MVPAVLCKKRSIKSTKRKGEFNKCLYSLARKDRACRNDLTIAPAIPIVSATARSVQSHRHDMHKSATSFRVKALSPGGCSPSTKTMSAYSVGDRS